MKPLFLIKLLFVFSIGVAQAQVNETIRMPTTDSLQAWLKKYKIPAVGIGTIEQGRLNRIIVQGELKKGVPAPYNAIFDVASLTKAITTHLTLHLVGQGQWDLDKPLYHYWVDPDVKDDPLHKKLTTRHVLSHRTGFVNWRRMHKTKKLTFDSEPGTKFGYSGEGFEYLRRALEAKFNTTLDKLCQQYVFDPMEMNDTHLIWRKQVKKKQVAIGHNKKQVPYPLSKRKIPNAADDLLTTVEDYATFGVNILKHKGISNKLYQTMIRPHSKVKQGVAFGLGWVIFDQLPNGEYALFIAGSSAGAAAIMLLLPKSQRGLVVMTNSDQRALVMRLIGETLDVGKDILKRF